MSSCIDTNLIELIARNVIARMIQDHTLQAGLRSCAPDCSWLGHETRVATCDMLPDIEDALDDFLCNAEFRACVEGIIRNMWTCGDFVEVTHDDTLAGRGTTCSPLSVNVEALNIPEIIGEELDDFLCNTAFRACVLTIIRELWTCGDFTSVVHDDTLTGTGTDCAPLSVNPDAICFPGASSVPDTNGTELPTYVIGNRSGLLGRPDGWMLICGRKVPYWN